MAGSGIFISEVTWVLRGINGWLMEIGVLTQRRKKEIDVKGRVSIGVELSCRESQGHSPSNTYTFLLICFPDCAKKSNTAKWQCQLLFQWQTYYVLRMLVGRMENMSVKSQINRTKTLGKESRQFMSCNGIKNPLVHHSVLPLGSYICAFCHEKYNICQ